MMDITDAGCKTCTGAGDMVADWYGNHGWIVGGQMVVHSSTTAFYKTPDATYQAVIVIHQKHVTSYKQDKTVDADIPDTIPRPDILVASYSGGGWTAHKAEHLTKE
ncbi:hypothetical protein B5P43_18730 [Bacillus sp. SRB_336]|nr:hypothetical protein B5P43_18730 [Bacillus sp. SRB_336]